MESKHEKQSFLLDTGTDVSLIKISTLKNDTLISEDKKFVLRGIHNSANSNATIGYLSLI